MKHKVHISEKKISDAINCTNTMGEAAVVLGINYRTFKKIAESYDLYKPIECSWKKKFELSDILNGKHPQYPTSKLSKRLVENKLIEYKCNSCGIADYNNQAISLELNHIDGNRANHKLENLELLCPNCHSQTPTYRSKKLKNFK
jgi:5-methylcytosine-specific restriction endonuclease McrA